MYKEEITLETKVQRIKVFFKGGRQEIINLGKRISINKAMTYLAEIGYKPSNIVGLIGMDKEV